MSFQEAVMVKRPFVALLRMSTSAVFAVLIGMTLPQGVSAQTELAIDEVVVTARKRDESLSDIPDSITVIGAQVIETANVSTIRDFADLTPNLTIIDQLRPGTQTMTIRGMTTVQNGELPVAFVVDGVNVPSMNFINQELVDIDRIEILRGPQGTLYGRGAVGGAINIVTKKPTDELEGRFRLTYAEGNALFVGGTGSGPMSDTARFRLSVSHRTEDGLIDNVGAGTEADFFDETSIQGRLEFQPSDALTLEIRGRYLEGEAGGIYLVPVTTAQIDDFSIPVSANLNGEDERDTWTFSVKADYVFDNRLRLTSMTGLHNTESFWFGDGDFSTVQKFAQDWTIDVYSYNQELRITSDDAGPTRWIGGLFFQEREDTEFTDFGTEGPNRTIGFAFPGGAREIRDRRSWAVFGQVDHDFNDRFALSAGLRFDEEDNRTYFGQLGISPEDSFSEWQPKVSLAYSLSDDVMGYLTVSRGFRPGGFSNTSGVLYENEVSENLELGVKASLTDSRVQLNLAVFHIDFQDQQLFFSRVTNAGVQRFIINVAEATNIGAEIELAARITENFRLNASYGLTNTEIADFDGTGRFDGNDTPQVNDFSFNLAAECTNRIANLDFTGRLDYERRGEVDWDLANLVTTPEKDYVNLYLSIGNDDWNVFAFGRNLLDEQQPTAIGTDVFGPGNHLRAPSRPRQVGIGFNRSF